MKKQSLVLFGLLTVIPLFVLTFVVATILQVPADAVHYHANFVVVKDGNVMDFSDMKYMNVEPCSGEHAPAELQRVHLHDGNGGVVHVHAPRVTWKHLLEYLQLDMQTHMKVWSIGSRVALVIPREISLNDEIRTNERVVIVLGGKAEDPVPSEASGKLDDDADDYNTGKKKALTCTPDEHAKYTFWQRAQIAFGW